MSTEEVRRKVHAATDAIDVPAPDPRGLLERAQESGGGSSRMVLVLVAAFVVAVGVAVTMVVRGAGEPDLAGDPDDYVEGSAQALAALAVERLGLDPDVPSSGGPNMDDPDMGGEPGLFANLVVEGNREDTSATQLSVGTGLDSAEPEMCTAELTGCVPIATDRGEVHLVWMVPDASQESEDLPMGFLGNMTGVGWVDPDSGDLEFVMLTDPAVTGDPRELELRFSVDDLVDLVTDPRFGRMTTPELAGVELAGWSEFDEELFDGGDSAMESMEEFEEPEMVPNPLAGDVTSMVKQNLGVTPRNVSGFNEDVHADAFIKLPGRPSTHLNLMVSADAEEQPTCKEDFLTCDTWQVAAGEVTLGWESEDVPDPQAFPEEGLELEFAEEGAALEEQGTSYSVWLRDSSELQSVHVWMPSVPETYRDPRELDLPVTIDQLVALLSDPGVALP